MPQCSVMRRGAEGELASSHLAAVEGEALAEYLFVLNNSASVSPESYRSGFRVGVGRYRQCGARFSSG